MTLEQILQEAKQINRESEDRERFATLAIMLADEVRISNALRASHAKLQRDLTVAMVELQFARTLALGALERVKQLMLPPGPPPEPVMGCTHVMGTGCCDHRDIELDPFQPLCGWCAQSQESREHLKTWREKEEALRWAEAVMERVKQLMTPSDAS